MKKYYFIILMAIIPTLLLSQEVNVKAILDSTNFLVGDQFKLRFEVKSNLKANIVWPKLEDTLDGRAILLIPEDTTVQKRSIIEIISKSKIDTLVEDDKLTLSQSITLTCFDSGSYTIPSYTFIYEKAGSTTLYPLSSEELRFDVASVKLDSTIIDIKDVLDEPVSFEEYLPYIIGFLAFVGLSYLAYYLYKKFKRKEKIVLKYDPKIPAHILALEALKQLDSEKLWQKGYIKKFYIRLTEIVWVYIERRFFVPAVEMTTTQIIQSIERAELSQDLFSKLKYILEQADLVKFAKFQPLPNEHTNAFNFSVEFVESTIQQEVQEIQNISKSEDIIDSNSKEAQK